MVSAYKGIHPICEIFPMMDEGALANLASDIRSNGLLNPIIVHDGLVIDGRNRVKACEAAGVKPKLSEWSEVYKGPMSVGQWIWSINVERRHLTAEQIAMAITVRRYIEEREAARLREVEGGRSAGKGRPAAKGMANSTPPNANQKTQDLSVRKGKTRDILAAEAGVSQYQINRAINIQKAVDEGKVDPEVTKDIIAGKVSTKEVHRQISGKAKVNKRDEILANSANNHMVESLSLIRGACKNLARVNIDAVKRHCAPGELRDWIRAARWSARQLRTFAAALKVKEYGNEESAAYNKND